jgi:hypothetical protein
METIKWHYYQFRKKYDYPIYLRFKHDESNQKIIHLLSELGFNELTEAEIRKIPIQRYQTRLLTMQNASARLTKELTGTDLLEQYGPEVLSLQAGVPVYTYRKVGMMAMPTSKNLWDLALHPDLTHTDHMIGIRIILVRFLSQALSDNGVLSYWGTQKDDSLIVMKQLQSFGEAIFIDHEKKMIFSNGGEMKLTKNIRLIRKDKEGIGSGKLSREETISFLSVSTCLLSFTGLTLAMKKSIYQISADMMASYGVMEAPL